MEMKTKVELVKRLDEHECILTWSGSAPAEFIDSSVDDFKAFVVMKMKEMAEAKQKTAPVVQPE